MSVKSSWHEASIGSSSAPFGPNSAVIEGFLAQVRALTRDQIVRLDLAERRDAGMLEVAWIDIRDRLRDEPTQAWRLAARTASGEAAREAGQTQGIKVPDDDGYWQVRAGIGCGAARLARYAACALVAPELVDPDLVELVLRPWRSVRADIGDR